MTTKDEKWLGDRARAETGQDPRLRSYRLVGALVGLTVALAVLLLALLPLLR
ncbi:hypothetical protein GCM10023340_23690 [Nocardioides marinquilinus]|uniref:Uncharacterized protein n=1 Tax=Nocardioides marinquilinus TaxID=1210400 RepID=A0ABP9PSF8_9ACTN